MWNPDFSKAEAQVALHFKNEMQNSKPFETGWWGDFALQSGPKLCRVRDRHSWKHE